MKTTRLLRSPTNNDRRLALTDAGRDLLVEAVPIWRKTRSEVDVLSEDVSRLREDLYAVTFGKKRDT